MIEGLPSNDEDTEGISEKAFMKMLEDNFNNGLHTLVLIDDLMIATKSGPAQHFVDTLFISARHLNTAVWELTQTHTGSRTRRLQCSFLICFATPSDARSLAHIARSIRPETGGKDILEAYRTATSSREGHGCLVICLGQQPEFMFRNTDMRICFDLKPRPIDTNLVAMQFW